MIKDFDDIDNDMMALFLDDKLSEKEQMQVTNSVRTYKNLWLLSNMYRIKKKENN